MAQLSIEEYIQLAERVPNFKAQIELTIYGPDSTKAMVEIFESQLNQENKALRSQVENLNKRIRWAIDHCSTCSPKPGMPQLCPACVMLQAGYAPGSKEEYEAYLKR